MLTSQLSRSLRTMLFTQSRKGSLMNKLLIRKWMFSMKIIPTITLVSLIICGSAQAQSTSVRSQIAELSQRFIELEQKYNLIKLEVGNLTAENNRLKQEVAILKANDSGKNVENVVNAKLNTHKKDTELYVKEQYEKMLKALSNQIPNISTASIKSAPTSHTITASNSFNFSNDFPRNGNIYIVQTGDTLSRIASRFGSTIKHIQNANKIANANSVQVGQKLFIPVEKK